MNNKQEIIELLKLNKVQVEDGTPMEVLKNNFEEIIGINSETAATEATAATTTIELPDALSELKLQEEQLDIEIKILSKQLKVKELKSKLEKNDLVEKIDLSVLNVIAPSFAGTRGEDVQSWIAKIENIFEAFNYNAINKYIAIRSLLTGQAKAYAEAINTYTYEETKNKLLNEFSYTRSAREVRRELGAREMQAQEDLMQYIREMQIIAAQATVMDEEVMEAIVRGIRKLYKIPEAMYEAENINAFKEAARQLDKPWLGSRGRTLSKNKMMSGVKVADRNKFEYRGDRSNPDTRRTDEEVRCYNCFKYGHYQGACSAPRRPWKCCFICSEMGHTRHECPEKINRQQLAAANPEPEAKAENNQGQLENKNHVSVYVKESGIIIVNRVYAFFDTGSVASFINENLLKKWKKENIKNNTEATKSYEFRGMGNKKLEVRGKLECEIEYRKKKYEHEFFILNEKDAIVDMIIGQDLLKKMGIQLTQNKKNEIKMSKLELMKWNKNENEYHNEYCRKFNLCKGKINCEENQNIGKQGRNGQDLILTKEQVLGVENKIKDENDSYSTLPLHQFF